MTNPGIALLRFGGRKAILGGFLAFSLVLAGDWLAPIVGAIFQAAELVLHNVGELLTGLLQATGAQDPWTLASLLLAILWGLGTSVLIALFAYVRITLLAASACKRPS